MLKCCCAVYSYVVAILLLSGVDLAGVSKGLFVPVALEDVQKVFGRPHHPVYVEV